MLQDAYEPPDIHHFYYISLYTKIK